MTIETIAPDFQRDRWQRPLITPADGGKPVAYMRTTRYVSVLEDLYNLQQWEKRMVALGLADRADLLLAVAAHRDDKQYLNKVCDEAKAAAKASASATTGTALHKLTDIVDSGGKLPALPAGPAASLAAFQAATASLKVEAIEAHTVLDTHQVAGTADRIYTYQGKRYIGDTKSGNIELGIQKIAMQLAVYARSWRYDVTTGERTAHGCETTRAIVMHLPATDDPAEAKCELVWVDIEAGWEAVMVARDVWKQRKVKFKDLTEPFVPDVPVKPSLRLQKADEQRTVDTADSDRDRLMRMVRACPTPEAVRQLWADYQDRWDDDLTAVAKETIAKLPTAS